MPEYEPIESFLGNVIEGDCIEVMARMPSDSITAVVCDPPYGLEFMSKEWDGADGFRRSLNPADIERDNVFGRTSAKGPEYRTTGAGKITKPGIGERDVDWPSQQGWNQYRCANCGHLSHGGSPCQCENPQFVPADNRWHLYQEWTERWAREAYRVLKPGGYLVCAGATRTHHRQWVAIEDAGFEIRDQIMHVFLTGFPKSHDVSKAIDRMAGAEREVIGTDKRRDIRHGQGRTHGWGIDSSQREGDVTYMEYERTAPSTEEAKKWSGYGSALKPAYEPWLLARKPLAGTLAQNVLDYGTGALNIDGTRIGLNPGYSYDADHNGTTFHGEVGQRIEQTAEKRGKDRVESTAGRWPSDIVMTEPVFDGDVEGVVGGSTKKKAPKGRDGEATADKRYTEEGSTNFAATPGPRGGDAKGRWPSDIVLTEPVFDGGVEGIVGGGERSSGLMKGGTQRTTQSIDYGVMPDTATLTDTYGDSGGVSRIFIIPKAARSEKEPNWHGMAEFEGDEEAGNTLGPMAGRGQPGLRCRNCGHWKVSGNPCVCAEPDWEQTAFERPKVRNDHPTVKNLDLMCHLVRLVTPPPVMVLECTTCGTPYVEPMQMVRSGVRTATQSAVLLPRVSRQGSTGATEELSSVREGIPTQTTVGEEPSEVLLERVREQVIRDTAPSVRALREGVPPISDQAAVLFEEVREQGDSAESPINEGLRTDAEGVHRAVEAGPSDGNADRLSVGAPIRDGGNAWPDATSDRSGGPPERSQRRQPSGESTRADEESSRRPSETATQTDRVSELPLDNIPVRSCTACGGILASVRRGGIVLDPFAGSGSTLKAAEIEGRQWVGIEREPKYVKIARARLEGVQRGMGL